MNDTSRASLAYCGARIDRFHGLLPSSYSPSNTGAKYPQQIEPRNDGELHNMPTFKTGIWTILDFLNPRNLFLKEYNWIINNSNIYNLILRTCNPKFSWIPTTLYDLSWDLDEILHTAFTSSGKFLLGDPVFISVSIFSDLVELNGRRKECFYSWRFCIRKIIFLLILTLCSFNNFTSLCLIFERRYFPI